jgi:hypothetical protein
MFYLFGANKSWISSYLISIADEKITAIEFFSRFIVEKED